jgi:exopolysaccharide biosynthesis predicted pyruvyltransferase EpsI
VSFLSKHEYIYTTRLHGAILALLLGKRFFLINNNYGKNKNFFETWLTEKDEDIHFLAIISEGYEGCVLCRLTVGQKEAPEKS